VLDHLCEVENAGRDHGLFQVPDATKRHYGCWLKPTKTLAFYDIAPGEELVFKKKHRPLRIRLPDQALKKIIIDETEPVSMLMSTICKKIHLNNPDEFALQRDNGKWLKKNVSLADQSIFDAEEVLLLKKRFFFTDAHVDTHDPIQLHLLYAQCVEAVISGEMRVTEEEAIQLAALQVQMIHGTFDYQQHGKGYINPAKFLPTSMISKKEKKMEKYEKSITNAHKMLVDLSPLTAEYRYVQLCRANKYYGNSLYEVKIPHKKHADFLLGVNKNGIAISELPKLVDFKSFEYSHLRRWAVNGQQITFDFGDYASNYLIFETDKAEEISELIGGYIDIILAKQRDVSRTEVEFDDAMVAQEVEVITPRVQSVATMTTTPSIDEHKRADYDAPLGGEQVRFLAGVDPALSTYEVRDMQQAMRALQNLGSDSERGLEKFDLDWQLQALTNIDSLKYHMIDLQKAVADPTLRNLGDVSRAITMDITRVITAVNSRGDDLPLPSDFDEAVKKVAESLAKLVETKGAQFTEEGNNLNKSLAHMINTLEGPLLNEHAWRLVNNMADELLTSYMNLESRMKRGSSTPRGTEALAAAQRAREKLNEMLSAIKTGPSKMDKKALDDWIAQAKQMQEIMKPLDEEPKLKSRLDTVKANIHNLSEAFIAIKPRLRAKVEPADVVLSTIDIELRAANTDKFKNDGQKLADHCQDLNQTVKSLERLIEQLPQDQKEGVVEKSADLVNAGMNLDPMAVMLAGDPTNADQVKTAMDSAGKFRKALRKFMTMLGKGAADMSLNDAAMLLAAALTRLINAARDAGLKDKEMKRVMKTAKDHLNKLIDAMNNKPDFKSQLKAVIPDTFELSSLTRDHLPRVDDKSRNRLQSACNWAQKAAELAWSSLQHVATLSLNEESVKCQQAISVELSRLESKLIQVTSPIQFETRRRSSVSTDPALGFQLDTAIKSVCKALEELVEVAPSGPGRVAARLESITSQCCQLGALIDKVPAGAADKIGALEASRDVFKACQAMLVMLQDTWDSPVNSAVKIQSLTRAAEDLSQAINSLKDKCQAILPMNTVNDIEKELEEVLKAINTAAEELVQRKLEQEAIAAPDEATKKVHDAIFDAVQALTRAAANLVQVSATVQKQLNEENKNKPGDKRYCRDPTWAQGLISAARMVSGTVQMLVDQADGLFKGEKGDEHLTAAARAVSASTSQLVIASCVKTSQRGAHDDLTRAAKLVAEATARLVKQAQQSSSSAPDAANRDRSHQRRNSTRDDERVTYQIKELECVAKITRLEKELELARAELDAVRKSRYEVNQA
jgi:uncharacterized protein YqgV (UPF0045/DUF77 family)/molybdopterin converting factor small subunit